MKRVVVWLVGYVGNVLNLGTIRLLFQVPVGVMVFIGLSYCFRLNPMTEYVKMSDEALENRFQWLQAILRHFA